MRYTEVNEIKLKLKNYNFDFTTYDDDFLSMFIDDAETYIDNYCERVFNFRKVVELHNGSGSWTIVLKQYPVFYLEKLTCRYYPLSVVRVFYDGDGYIILNRKIGKVAIRPSFALISAFPPEYAQYYAYIFPRGESNISAEYYVGWFFVGDNISMSYLSENGFFDIMTKEESNEKIYFNLPIPISRVGWKMFKGFGGNFVEDKDWNLESNTRISIDKEKFDDNTLYRLVYIPLQIKEAADLITIAMLLSQVGGSDDKKIGGAGVQSLSVSGFSESYGELGKYTGQIKKFYEQAHNLLERYKIKSSVSVGR